MLIFDRMNWLDPPVEPPNVAEPQDSEAPSESNLNYWAARLLPLHDPTPTYSTPKPDTDVEIDTNSREVVFVGCNRIGTEEGTFLPYLGFYTRLGMIADTSD